MSDAWLTTYIETKCFTVQLYFTGYSSSDGNIGGDDYERKPWSVPSSVRTIHGFDLSQVQDLDNMDNNGATVTGNILWLS